MRNCAYKGVKELSQTLILYETNKQRKEADMAVKIFPQKQFRNRETQGELREDDLMWHFKC